MLFQSNKNNIFYSFCFFIYLQSKSNKIRPRKSNISQTKKVIVYFKLDKLQMSHLIKKISAQKEEHNDHTGPVLKKQRKNNNSYKYSSKDNIP